MGPWRRHCAHRILWNLLNLVRTSFYTATCPIHFSQILILTPHIFFCLFVPSRHKLKDSAYWYHMHYTHGISCATGKFFSAPRAGRSAQGVVGYDALCSNCDQWVYVGRLDRWHTPYFRHAYKCQTSSSNRPRVSSRSSRSSANKGSFNRPGNPALRTLRSL